ncbi:MAG: amidohydrolase family protein [Thermodesulfobacteriota bacterium]
MPGKSSRAPAPVIDVHAHCLPRFPFAIQKVMDLVTARPGPNRAFLHKGITSVIYPEVADIDLQMRVLEEAGITRSLLSFSMELELISRKAWVLPQAWVMRMMNDCMAELVARYPDRLDFMVMVNPFHRESAAECRRCLEGLGARGISIGTSFAGEFPDSPRAEPLWELAESLGTPVFLHPPFAPLGYTKMDLYRLEEAVGRPFDTTMAAARMILSGVFDRHPGLQVILPHSGGALLCLADRLDFTLRLGYETLPPGQAASCKRRPGAYLRTNFFADTMGFSPAKLRHCVELFGTDRVVFGSDYAPVPLSPREQVEIVKGLGLREADTEKILWKNAAGLFGYA